MGSRAIVIVCRDEETARKRFGVVNESSGIVYTRTGRRFFDNGSLEEALLARLKTALTVTGFWEEFNTGWVCLDCELLPWSAKAQELIRQQYAAVGAAAQGALSQTVTLLEQTARQAVEGITGLLHRYQTREQLVSAYNKVYRHYAWPVAAVDDLKLAPFHLLATEGAVHLNQPHTWHMEKLAALCKADEKLLLATPYRVVELDNEESRAEAMDWWEELTARGGEGMVVKPFDFIAKRPKGGLIQPAVKCRGREYLRIIYGPEYTLAENLERLRLRGLGAKRSLALREFALGVEGLERFVRGEPLRRVHECSFGVLALESEPVDPWL